LKEINKIDFMVGAFLAFLTSRKIAPVLVEATEHAKIVKFMTNNNNYNVYFKYSASPRKSTVQDKEFTTWNISYTPDDLTRIRNTVRNCKENDVFLAMVLCTIDKLTNTNLVALSYEELEKCIGNDTINENKNLVVRNMKSSPYIYCHGTALNAQEALKVYKDIEKIIEF